MEIAAVQSAESRHSGLGNGSSRSLPPPSSSMPPLALSGKIEFRPARKPFNGRGSGDIRTQRVNLDSGRRRPPGDLDPGGHPRRKIDGSDFLDDGLDPELPFGITSRRIILVLAEGRFYAFNDDLNILFLGAGLENLGNTCFLNSVLQCLTYTEPLAAYLQSGKHQNSCRIAGFCALCAIQKHVSNALQSTGRSLIPKDLILNLLRISRNFRNARQEDAHEYMVNLLESMHKCCLPSEVPSESPAAYQTSLVHKIFGGRLRSQVECQQCFYCSNKYDPFLDLSLEIVKADSLLVALQNFTAAEMLDGGEKHYQCQQCKQKVRANKQLTIHHAPYVLTIHLKRFHAHNPGWKIDKKVLFDHSLDMKPFVSDSYDGDLKYSLYGVLVHYGLNTHSGHYVCFVCASSGMWYLLNDNEVRQVSEKHVLEQKAYMLFYVRDRKNVSLRKPIDVIPKDPMKAALNNNANLVYRSFLRESSSSHVNGSYMAGCSAGDKMNILNVRPVKELFAKEALSQQNNEIMNPECAVLNQDPVLGPSSSAPLLKDMSKCDYSGSLGPAESLSLSGPSVNSSSDTPKLEHVSSINGAKFSDSDEVTFCSTGSQTSSNGKLVMNVALKQINNGLDAGDSTDVLPVGPCDRMAAKVQCSAACLDSGDKPLDNTEPVKAAPYKTNCGSSLLIVDSISSEQPAGNILNDHASDHASDAGKEIAHQLVNSSIPLVVPNACLLREEPECRRHKKLEKKLMKYQTLRMHVGSNFFRAALGLQKKKKDKNKKSILGPQNPVKEQLLDNFSPSESGPSTSKHSMAISVGSMNSQSRSAEFGLEKRGCLRKFSNLPVEDIINGELGHRNNQKGAALVMDGQQKGFNAIQEANQHSARDLYSARNSNRDSSQKGMMGILSQGLEDTGVARWDEIALPPSDNAEANTAQHFSVGYVPDERDKEYDQGKRKKMRHSQHKFGGLNPFQEIATKKTQFKKVDTLSRK